MGQDRRVYKLRLFDRGKVLSIDFGASEIKIVEGKYSKKGIIINKSFSIAVPENVYFNGQIEDMSELESVLEEGLKTYNIGSGSAIAVINSSMIITREITMPKVGSEQIESILKYQVGDYIPIHPDDYVVKHITLGTIVEDGIEKVKLLLIGVPKNIVESHFNLLKNVGLKPYVLDYQGNAMAKLLDYSDIINKDYNTVDLVIASVDIGYSSTKLAIVKNGNIEVSRVIDIGSKTLYSNLSDSFDCSLGELEEKVINIKDITHENNDQDEDISEDDRLVQLTRDILQTIMEKIEEVFRYYTSRENSNIINLILLQGGVSNIKEIDSLFTNYFDISSVKLQDLEKIDLNKDLKTYSNAIGGLIRINEVKK